MLEILPSVCVEVDDEKPDSADGVGARVACIGTFCTYNITFREQL